MAEKSPKNQEVIFPEESHFVIQEILKKYKLYRESVEIMKDLEERLEKAQTFQEKKEIAEQQPERRLAKAIKRAAEGEIPLEDFPKKLQEIFNIEPKIARDLARDIEKNVLAFAKKVFIEREATPSSERPLVRPLLVTPSPKEPLETPKIPKTAPPKVEKAEVISKEEKPQKPDTYRESIG